SNIEIDDSLESAIKDADCLVIVTKHKFFQKLNLQKIQKLTNNPLIIVDGQNTFNPKNLPNNLIYQCIGCPIFIS
ncbi:MAG: hypothetical protein HWN67_16670, partial [Candidatus Helarchaeota archaeon]|nr:hypothetical protein [Candidatus Helarchaeota archaeon]